MNPTNWKIHMLKLLKAALDPLGYVAWEDRRLSVNLFITLDRLELHDE